MFSGRQEFDTTLVPRKQRDPLRTTSAFICFGDVSSRLGIGDRYACQGLRGVLLDMSRIHPECPDSDPSDLSAAADILLRQEPDEEEDEEDEEDDEGDDKEDDDKDNDGYSERARPFISVGEG